MTRVKILLLAVVMVALLPVLSGCVMGQVTTQVLTEEPQKIENVLTSVDRSQYPSDYLYGVIIQKSWQESRGWRADPYNKVQLLVQLPNKEIRIVVPNGRTEYFVATYLKPGNVVAFKDKDGYYVEHHRGLNIREFLLISTGERNGLTEFSTTTTQ